MSKKIICTVLTLTMLFSLAACSIDVNIKTPAEEDTTVSVKPDRIEIIAPAIPEGEYITGGWSYENDKETTADAIVAFDKATAKYAETIELIKVLGHQVVSGTNYSYLCKFNPDNAEAMFYAIVKVYSDLDGNAEIMSADPIDLNENSESNFSGVEKFAKDAIEGFIGDED